VRRVDQPVAEGRESDDGELFEAHRSHLRE